MNSTTASKTTFAVWAVRVAGFWLLLGAAAKLFVGTPKDLPLLVHDLTPFDIDLTFRLVIGVELALVCLAFFKPRVAWLPLAALFVFFDFILMSQLGEKSCGCFGGSITVPPWVMLAIDSLVLLALLASMPWKNLTRPGVRPPLVASAVVASLVLPWLVIDVPYWLESRTADAPSTAATNAAGAPALPAGTQKARPRNLSMKPDKWVGKSVFDIPELTDWLESEKLPIEGKLVLWRQGCEHCRDHLREMAQRDKGQTPIVLVQLRDDLKSTSLIEAMPDGPHVTKIQYPDDLQIVVQTPWDFDVQGGVIQTAVLDNKPH
ncbi:MAG: MauE/DoxX family redox-associated membrane protein [Planctomycetota bacterium]